MSAKSTTVFLSGQGRVRLGPSDFIARGGEGAVYAHGDLALKIYDDPDHALPPGKLRELQAIADPRVLAPTALVERGRPRRVVGYAMPRLDGGHPLCALFAQSFKQRHGLTPDHLRRIALELQARVTERASRRGAGRRPQRHELPRGARLRRGLCHRRRQLPDALLPGDGLLPRRH